MLRNVDVIRRVRACRRVRRRSSSNGGGAKALRAAIGRVFGSLNLVQQPGSLLLGRWPVHWRVGELVVQGNVVTNMRQTPRFLYEKVYLCPR